MSSITVRNLDQGIKELLRIRAAEHGHSMEAEVRSILQATLQQSNQLPRAVFTNVFAPVSSRLGALTT